jgi:hypothetical protein
MSNVIDFLIRLGSDSSLRHADSARLAHELALAAIDPELQAAILAGDQQRLENVLGARTNVICGLSPAEPDDAPEPADDDEEIRALRLARVG